MPSIGNLRSASAGHAVPQASINVPKVANTVWRHTTVGTSIGFRQNDGLDLTATKFNEE